MADLGRAGKRTVIRSGWSVALHRGPSLGVGIDSPYPHGCADAQYAHSGAEM